jgi:hypothetical protein
MGARGKPKLTPGRGRPFLVGSRAAQAGSQPEGASAANVKGTALCGRFCQRGSCVWGRQGQASLRPGFKLATTRPNPQRTMRVAGSLAPSAWRLTGSRLVATSEARARIPKRPNFRCG